LCLLHHQVKQIQIYKYNISSNSFDKELTANFKRRHHLSTPKSLITKSLNK
jgi:hypothetical protein